MSFLWRDIADHVHDSASPRLARRGFIKASLTLAGALAAANASGLLARPAQAADVSADAQDGAMAARQFVTGLADRAIAIMADASLKPADRVAKFDTLFAGAFALPEIGQRVLGRYWAQASQEQRDTFLKLFEEQEVLVYAARFQRYNGQRLAVDSTETAAGTWLVRTHVDQESGGPIPLDWTLANTAAGWRITDLTVDGASMTITLRQEFASVLQANGGKVEALLAAMQKKIDQLKPA